LAVHADTVLALALSPDGQFLASSSFYDPITVWDLQNGQKRHGLLGHSARIDALAFSPNGEILASGSGDRTIKLWNVETGEEIRTLEGHTNQITDLVFNADGTILISSSWDGTVRVWNLKTRRPGRILELESGRVNAIALSSDGKKLAIASNTLQVWTLPSKRLILSCNPTESIVDVAFGPEDQTLFSAHSDRTVKIWKWEEKPTKKGKS
jgi:WD40 repeat protein